ncbi:hypothetical protein [Oscillatoria acuminata]|uniref:Uncharacterized protein n=1 Tax=Oscillatoria acuminata PCC 6304 TaxID=56110 RepID=K9TL91_9CYAN|nr:hypothetical protein [Oscillatoria acuminata]AFY82769.1 hypothetical protein Oscil6304_3190 [Oscillatoria acuminata PCC 6304]
MLTCQRFTIKTGLKPYQVREKLMGIVEPTCRIGETSSPPLYRGKINKDSFQISKIIYHRRSDRYRESFLPVLVGQIREHDSGSQIDIQVKMPPLFLVGIGIWLMTMGREVWVSLMMLQNGFSPTFAGFIGIFLLGLAIQIIIFLSIAHNSKKFLINFLKD